MLQSTVLKMAGAKEFVQSLSMEVLETFKKDLLMQVAHKLQLEVKSPTHKHEVKMCDWYHLLMTQMLISTFNTLKE